MMKEVCHGEIKAKRKNDFLLEGEVAKAEFAEGKKEGFLDFQICGEGDGESTTAVNGEGDDEEDGDDWWRKYLRWWLWKSLEMVEGRGGWGVLSILISEVIKLELEFGK
ncbi:Uncharacterized protein Adt_32774 [Abeliophyllum distichum]|uniref:Uncharacterized protein n=1 Tax=Abeliophyllum distichum TaxID=126358 RepID=A0ABD1QUC4_9LAMI